MKKRAHIPHSFEIRQEGPASGGVSIQKSRALCLKNRPISRRIKRSIVRQIERLYLFLNRATRKILTILCIRG